VNYKTYEIYKALNTAEVYSTEDAKCFGNQLAKSDSLNGVKQILTYYGTFTTDCLKCAYHKFGFQTVNFAPADLVFESVDEFIQAYNTVMESLLTDEQLNEIEILSFNSKQIFSFSSFTKNKYDINIFNDSILNFKMYFESLENLFLKDVKYINVLVATTKSDSTYELINYLDLKNKGINIKTTGLSGLKLFLTYDLSLMPNNYKVCWCEAIESKYRVMVPIKID